MHDPCTVAFDIRMPFCGHRMPNGKRLGYSLLTIWHVDPERNAGERGLRGDDSCGWFDAPSTPTERVKIEALGRREFSTLFGYRWATIEGKSYASVCYEPSPYDAVFYAWRLIDRELRGRYREPSRSALRYIKSLADSPWDNLRSIHARVNSAETCAGFFLCVFRAYKRHHRPWWRHPRLHVHHWRLQFHPWQQLRRRLFDRCADCGKPFKGESPVTTRWHSEPAPWFGSAPDLHHAACLNIKPYTGDGRMPAPPSTYA